MKRIYSTDEALPFIERDPETNIQMYEALEGLKDGSTTVLAHKTALLVDGWALMLTADDPYDVLPLIRTYFTEHLVNGPSRFFFSLDSSIADILKTEYVIDVNDDTYLWTLEQPPQENVDLDSLGPTDIPTVANHWPYGGEDKVDFINWLVNRLPSSVVRGEDQQPLAWSFCYAESPHHINMGGLFVLPEHRRKGFGSMITTDLTRKVFQRGKKPLVHIHVSNTASQAVVKAKGFVRGNHVLFGDISEPDITEH